MTARVFAPGFRLSVLDAIVLVLGAAATALTIEVGAWLAGIIAFTVGHFFLFCNVLRMPRPLELAWACVFVALAAATLTGDWPGWPASFGIAALMTLVVADIQLRHPSYHGIGWQRINPGLRDWWQAQT